MCIHGEAASSCTKRMGNKQLPRKDSPHSTLITYTLKNTAFLLVPALFRALIRGTFFVFTLRNWTEQGSEVCVLHILSNVKQDVRVRIHNLIFIVAPKPDLTNRNLHNLGVVDDVPVALAALNHTDVVSGINLTAVIHHSEQVVFRARRSLFMNRLFFTTTHHFLHSSRFPPQTPSTSIPLGSPSSLPPPSRSASLQAVPSTSNPLTEFGAFPAPCSHSDRSP